MKYALIVAAVGIGAYVAERRLNKANVYDVSYYIRRGERPQQLGVDCTKNVEGVLLLQRG